jgi:hypothetical protein
MDKQIERRITEQAARDQCKTGEGKKPTGLFKRIADDQRKSGESQRIRHTVDPRY